MLKKHLFLSLLMAVSTATVSAETHHAHWSYTGENDAAHWGDLKADNWHTVTTSPTIK